MRRPAKGARVNWNPLGPWGTILLEWTASHNPPPEQPGEVSQLTQFGFLSILDTFSCSGVLRAHCPPIYLNLSLLYYVELNLVNANCNHLNFSIVCSFLRSVLTDAMMCTFVFQGCEQCPVC